MALELMASLDLGRGRLRICDRGCLVKAISAPSRLDDIMATPNHRDGVAVKRAAARVSVTLPLDLPEAIVRESDNQSGFRVESAWEKPRQL